MWLFPMDQAPSAGHLCPFWASVPFGLHPCNRNGLNPFSLGKRNVPPLTVQLPSCPSVYPGAPRCTLTPSPTAFCRPNLRQDEDTCEALGTVLRTASFPDRPSHFRSCCDATPFSWSANMPRGFQPPRPCGCQCPCAERSSSPSFFPESDRTSFRPRPPAASLHSASRVLVFAYYLPLFPEPRLPKAHTSSSPLLAN